MKKCISFFILALLFQTAIGPACARAADQDISDLLNASGTLQNGDIDPGYIRDLIKASRRNTDPTSRIQIYRRIGDCYFIQDNFAGVITWYGKVLAIDPSLRDNSPIGYRIQRAQKWVLRRNLLTGSIAGLGLVAAALLFHGFINRKSFKSGLFLKRTGVYAIILGILVAAVFAADTAMFLKTARDLPVSFPESSIIVDPVIPLPFLDSSNIHLIVLTLIAGFLPFMITAFYRACSRRISRVVLTIILLITILSSWTLVLIPAAYDEFFDPTVVISGQRIIFKGEIEDLFKKSPYKLFEANPDITGSKNSDMQLFLEKNFPQGKPER